MIIRLIISFSLIAVLANATYSQENRIILEIKAGVSYIPMWEQSESWGTLPYVEQYFPSFNSELNMGYNLNNNHSLRIAIGYLESHVKASSINGEVDWYYKGYPLSILYQYNLNSILNFAQPYVGGGLSFYWSTIQINADEFIGDKRSYQRDEIGLGLEGTIGLNFALVTNLNLLSEIKLRLSNASLISEESTYGSIEFTGIYFQLGLGYNL